MLLQTLGNIEIPAVQNKVKTNSIYGKTLENDQLSLGIWKPLEFFKVV
jgi:hypothetical protein